MATILLRIQKETRREALARALGKEHEIVVQGSSSTEQGPTEDVLIVDHTTLQQSGSDAVSRYKTHDSRPEAPVLLIVPSAQTAQLSSATWNEVDDVVEIPVRGPVMKSRVDSLLRLQEHAKESKSFREMAAKYKVMLTEQQSQLRGYKALFNSRACGTLVVQDSDIVEANTLAKQIFGTEDLVGQPLASLFPSQQADGHRSKGMTTELLKVADGKKELVNWTFKRPGGKRFTSSVVIRPVEFRNERCIQIVFPEGETGNDVNVA